MLNDPLAAALAKIINAERVGKREVEIKPVSVMIKKVLSIMNDHGYLGSFEEINDGRGGILKVNLLGNINKCGVIKPRFSAKRTEFEKWERRYLPGKDFGLLVVSTPRGVITQSEAKLQNTGGKLIAYCY